MLQLQETPKSAACNTSCPVRVSCGPVPCDVALGPGWQSGVYREHPGPLWPREEGNMANMYKSNIYAGP